MVRYGLVDNAGSSSDDEREIEGVDEGERRREGFVDVVAATRLDKLERDKDENVEFCSYSSV